MRSFMLLALAAAVTIVPGVTMAQAIPSHADASSIRKLPHDHPVHVTSLVSTNWSGYSVASSPGTVDAVQGVWTVPAVNPSSCPGGQAFFWVGIDGLEPGLLAEPRGRKAREPVETGSPTIERIGTAAVCAGPNPTYYAWFQLSAYDPITVIHNVQVAPGDLIEAEVRFMPAFGDFHLTIINWTRSQLSIAAGSAEQAPRSSAMWIVEAPAFSGIAPLADFDKVEFREAMVAASGSVLPIGSANGTIAAITMVSTVNSQVLKAAPGALFGQGSSFDVDWYSAGP